jgi:hypothetical protein
VAAPGFLVNIDIIEWVAADGHSVAVGRLTDLRDLRDGLRALGLDRPRPVLVIVGAASLDETELTRLRPLFTEGIAPLAQSLGAAIIDGGTDAGVMRLIGQGREVISGSFPLIGVAPADKVLEFDSPGSAGATPIEPHHTHVILVPAASWAAGAPWLSEVATALADEEPTVTVLIGGGKVSRLDSAASVKAARPLVAVLGTGGLADTLGDAVGGETGRALVEAIPELGLLTTVNLAEGPQAIADVIARVLGASPDAVPTD